MKGKYETDLMLNFESLFKIYLRHYLNNNIIPSSTKIDPLAKMILANNGCRFSDETYVNEEYIINKEYVLYFITGALGNEINEIFDFINIHGTVYFVIFLDAFKNINKKSESKNGITNPDDILGKSLYYKYLYKLANIFIRTTTNPIYFTTDYINTTIANNARYNSHIFAGSVIKEICGQITENDVEGSGIDYKTLLSIIKCSSLAYYGVRNRDEIKI